MNLEAEFMKPEGGPAFESLMLKICGVLYGTTFSLFGRNGQEQYGIDLYTSGFRICVQCKNYSNSKKLLKNMENDFNNAVEHFKGRMEEYILATTLEPDTEVQELAEKLAQKENIKFHTLFWDEIYSCLNQHKDFANKTDINLPSEYDLSSPDPNAPLWWMGTSQIQTQPLISESTGNGIRKRLSIPSLHKRKAELPQEPNQESEWADPREAMQEYESTVQWLDDLHTVHLGQLFMCSQGRGIFFLISHWDHGLAESLNRYFAETLEKTQSFADVLFDWVEITPDNYGHLCDQHSGTVIRIDENWDDIQMLKNCVSRWKNELGQKGQLIFHVHGNLSSYAHWTVLERKAKYCIQSLRSAFGQLPISLLTADYPFNYLFEELPPSGVSLEFPQEERSADWIRKNPDRLPDVLYKIYDEVASPEEQYQQLCLWLPSLSGWPDVLQMLFDSMDRPDDVGKLLDDLDLNPEMCAVALYRLYMADHPRWENLLYRCLDRCTVTARQTFQYLLNPGSLDPDFLNLWCIDAVLYTLLCDQYVDFLSEDGKKMQFLNGQLSLSEAAKHSGRNEMEYLKHLGSILLPEDDEYTDELTKNSRDIIRPYR